MAKPVTDEAPAVKAKPTITDLIEQAQEMELNTSLLVEEAREVDGRLRRAKEAAREAWDAIHAQLLAIKTDHASSDAYRSSKLGKLLENIR